MKMNLQVRKMSGWWPFHQQFKGFGTNAHLNKGFSTIGTTTMMLMAALQLQLFAIANSSSLAQIVKDTFGTGLQLVAVSKSLVSIMDITVPNLLKACLGPIVGFIWNLIPLSVMFFMGCMLLGVKGYLVWNRLTKGRAEVLRRQAQMEFQSSMVLKSMEKEKLRQQELIEELEFKDKQLMSYALSCEQKNMIMEELQDIIRKIERCTINADKTILLKELKVLVKENLIADKNWERFREFFQETQHGFFSKLLLHHPNLKSNDLKLCAVIRLNMNIKEASRVLGISPGSLKTARYRLRKKLDLAPEMEITDYLLSFERALQPKALYS